jgi:hypothetical protein
MSDFLNLVMLIAACAGALAFSILSAYAALRAGFALMRPQQRSVPMKARTQVARVS